MKYDLFISDFDGTLGTAPDLIEQETLSAIREYEEKGGKFVIVTGRPRSSILPICLKYDFKGIVISYQGAMITTIDDGQNLFVGGLDYKVAADIATDFIKEGVLTIAEQEDCLVCERRTEYITYYEEVVKIKCKIVKDLPSYIREEKRTVQKINVLCAPSQVKPLTEKMAKKYKGILFNNGSDRLIEAVNPSCSKGVAVKFLCDYYGIDEKRTLAVGDSTNDIELLHGGWHGVAVGDGMSELKAIADEVTVPYKDNPVKVLLEKYCL